MTSFKEKIQKKEESHAYLLGVEAFSNGLSMQSPYIRGEPADIDWVDGYLDAMFVRKL